MSELKEYVYYVTQMSVKMARIKGTDSGVTHGGSRKDVASPCFKVGITCLLFPLNLKKYSAVLNSIL